MPTLYEFITYDKKIHALSSDIPLELWKTEQTMVTPAFLVLINATVSLSLTFKSK